MTPQEIREQISVGRWSDVGAEGAIFGEIAAQLAELVTEVHELRFQIHELKLEGRALNEKAADFFLIQGQEG